MACDHEAVNDGPARTEGDAIRLLVVDDHPAIGLAIEAAARSGVSGGPAIEVVGSARHVGDAIAHLHGAEPRTDVVLCDIQLDTGLDGLEVVDAAREAGVKAIVLTSFDRSSLMRTAFGRGASGFLHKSADVTEILAAVRRVAGGGTAFSAATLDAARYAPRPPSAREIAVIAAIRSGATSDEIGARLGISSRTVESHVRRLFDRYGVVSRAELAVLAVNEGWIEA